MNQAQTFEPVKVYHEGILDRKQLIADKAKYMLKTSLINAGHQIDTIFTEHRFSK